MTAGIGNGSSDARVVEFRSALDSSKTQPSHYGLLGLMALLLVVDGYDTQAIGYVAPALVGAWGVARPALGPVFSLGLFGVMVGALSMTVLADRVGARRVLLGCTAVFGVLTLATATAASIEALMAMRFFTGVALGGAMPTAIALVSEYAPARARATMVTIAVCGFSVGGFLGGVVAATMIADFGWQSVFLVGGISPLLILPAMFLSLPDSLMQILSGKADAHSLRLVRRIAPAWTAPAAAAPFRGEAREADEVIERAPPVASLFAGGRAGATTLIWVVYFMNLLVLYTLSNWLPSLMTADGLSLQTANLATAFYQIGGTVGAVLIAMLCDRFPAQRVLAIAFASAAVSVFLIGAAHDHTAMIVAAIAAAGFGVVGGQNAANAFVGGFYPSGIRASGIGWALGVGRLGSIIGPLIVGALIAAGVETQTLLQLCAAPALAAAVAILFVGSSREKGARGPVQPAPIVGAVSAVNEN